MSNAVEVPEWLKNLPFAPEFHPTETEFADPIAYISKIEKEASAFGICKIIPPIPKPSKKYVFANLNKSLLKRPEVGSYVNIQDAGGSLSKSGCDRNVREVRALFTTRQQELGHCAYSKKITGMGSSEQPAAQKQVWQSGEFYTLEQFESKAKAFSRSLLRKFEEVTPLVVETLFWKATSEKPIYVEYANDVPGSGFSEPVGSVRRFHGHKTGGRRGFAQTGQRNSEDVQPGTSRKDSGVSGEVNVSTQNDPGSVLQSAKASSDLPPNLSSDEASQVSNQKDSLFDHEWEGTAGWKLSNSPWNLQVISRSAGSLTRFMVDDIPGVTSPMVYIGMLFSWFAWHVEDHELHSLNFLHFGSPKTWYSVPGDYAFHFEEVVRTEAYGSNMDSLSALAILGEKTTILSPGAVVRKGIPCCRLVQNPGEFVVTFPRAYHIGFSHGFNCGEAANFGTSQWLKVAKEAAVRRTTMDQLPMLSHQQLLYLLTMSFVSRLPSSLIPGVRSSRLRSRLKEEREWLVKKALIEDILEENILLNVLCWRDSSFRAVLWNSNLLPPCRTQFSSQTWITTKTTVSKTVEQSICLKSIYDQTNLFDQMKLRMDTMDDLDIIDLSGDFEISSGALQCVACGILGFPFMCVIQPSKKASKEIFPANRILMQKVPDSSQTKDSISASPVAYDDRWNASCGFLRPRLFCLEHAVQIEELLRPKGGVNILVICHSDYQKIKLNAVTIVEEIGCAFDYKEIALESASIKDLNLINLAVDDEKRDQCTEDWTAKLGVSLRHYVKVKKTYPAKQIEHALNFCGLFPVRTPAASNVLNIKWSSRKSRTKCKNMRKCHVNEKNVDGKNNIPPSCNSIEQAKTGNVVKRNPESSKPGNTKVLLQYSRRKYRNRSNDSVQTRRNVGCTNDSPLEVVSASDYGNICRQENVMSGENSERVGLLTSVGRNHLDSEKMKDAVENSVLTEQVYLQPSVTMGNQTSEKLVAKNEGSASTTSDCCKLQHGIKVIARTSEINEISDAENSCLSTFASPQSHINRGNEIMNAKSFGDGATNPLYLERSSEELSSEFKADITGKSGVNVALGGNTIHLPEVPHCKESVNTDIPASRPLANGKPEEVGPSKVDAEATSSRSLSKRKREVVLPDFNLNRDGFVKSPCEGLRLRIRKAEPTSKRSTTTKESEESRPTKMKKPPVNSFSGKEEKGAKTPNETDHRCDVDKCKMQFKTKAELLLHKRNRCPYEECGKRFSSHRKAIAHQRIHDEERRLKCTWTGCSMTFNTASARTNHMRRCYAETQPYKCKDSGCGLSFRFASQFNRHRRRTGHGENKPT